MKWHLVPSIILDQVDTMSVSTTTISSRSSGEAEVRAPLTLVKTSKKDGRRAG